MTMNSLIGGFSKGGNTSSDCPISKDPPFFTKFKKLDDISFIDVEPIETILNLFSKASEFGSFFRSGFLLISKVVRDERFSM